MMVEEEINEGGRGECGKQRRKLSKARGREGKYRRFMIQEMMK